MSAPSPQQIAIWQHMAATSGPNVVVDALAGVGKTTTLIYGVAQIPRSMGPVCLTTFGREPKGQMERLLVPSQYGTSVKVLTVNGLGWRLLVDAYPGLRNRELNEDSVYSAFRAAVAGTGFKREDVTAGVKLIGLAKAHLFDDADQIEKLAFAHGIEGKKLGRARISQAVAEVLARTLERFEEDGFTYDDQIWLVVKKELYRKLYRTVVVDEAQDLSPMQISLLLGVCSGRIIAFGDSLQSIFRFRGADERAIDRVAEALHAIRLPLTTTYRCSLAVVAEAHNFAPHLTARPDAPQGEVTSIDYEEMAELVEPGDYVIARSNRAVGEAFARLLDAGVPAKIAVDAATARAAADLVRGHAGKDMAALAVALDRARASIEKAEVTAANQAALDALRLAQGLLRFHQTPGSLARELASYADESTPPRGQKDFVWVATTHRAKGLEAPRVFVLRWTYMREDDMEAQNLMYVAITRAMNTLVYVDRADDESDGYAGGEVAAPRARVIKPGEPLDPGGEPNLHVQHATRLARRA